MTPGKDAELRGVIRTDTIRWVWAAALDWAVIASAMLVSGQLNHPFTYALAAFVIGTRQHALGILGHEGVHRLISRNQCLNDGLAVALCAWPLGVGLRAWRDFHFDHHRLVGTAHDPEVGRRNGIAPKWEPNRNLSEVAFRFALDLVGLGALDMIRMRWGSRPREWPTADKAGPALWMLLAIGSLVLFDAGYVVALWFVSLVTSSWAVTRLRIWSEHIGASSTHRLSAALWERLLFLPHYTWLHYEHHARPSVPYHRLPLLRKMLEGPSPLSFAKAISLRGRSSLDGKTGSTIASRRRSPPRPTPLESSQTPL